MGLNEVKLSHSIGVKLLKHILGVYCLVAVTLTLVHAVLEYKMSSEHLREDISNYEPFLRQSIGGALWHLDMDLLNRILQDVVNNEELVGASIRGARGELLAQRGVVARAEQDYPKLDLGYDSFVAKYAVDLIAYEFPVFDPNGMEQEAIGSVTFYSSPDVVLSKVEDTFLLILLAASVKTLLLCLLFVFFGRRLLGAPLARIVGKLRGLPLEAPEIEEKTRRSVDELGLLEMAFKTMELKLHATLQQLHEANQTLNQSNLVLQRATEQSPAAISIFDPDGKVVYTNPSFSRISGYSAEEAQHAYERCLYLADPVPAKIVALGQEERAEVCHFEAHNRSKMGGEYWVSSRLTPVTDEDGVVRHFLLITQDITELKQTALALAAKTKEQRDMIQKLAEAQNQLLQSEKMASIGQLAAGVAHEINNPVGYVNSNLETLAHYAQDLMSVIENYDSAVDRNGCQTCREEANKFKQVVDYDFLKEDLDNLLQESKEGIGRVKQIIKSLKDFSHADKGEWVFSDLHHGIDSTLNVVWNELKYKADVVKEFGELPEVFCIPAQLNQVFMNLLVNAAHAIEDRGVIRIRTGVEGDRAWIEVGDTGKGIDAEHLPRLFEPFFTTKPVGKGTGLGLSVSYGIVNKHGGNIEVDSTPGEGSRFRVWLPIKRSEAVAALAEQR